MKWSHNLCQSWVLPYYVPGTILFYVKGGGSPPVLYCRYDTKYNVARKLAKRNGAIIYAKAGRIYPTLYLALLFLIV